jgi:DNA-binding transcriptional LysR family regulator
VRPDDLRQHRHLVVRDSGTQRNPTPTSLEAKQRWTVSHMATSIEAMRSGFGFSWLPEDKIRAELASGALLPLPLEGAQERQVALYLIYADRDSAGPGLLRLVELLRENVANVCALRAPRTSTPPFTPPSEHSK